MPSSNSTRPAERSVRLDPLGVYGTRSARRRHQMQRRRQWQNGLLWMVGLLALSALLWWFWQPHPTSLRANWTRELPFRPATAPLTNSGGTLLLTSKSGGLWQVSPSNASAPGAPRRLFATAFPPGALPLQAQGLIFWPGSDGTLVALDATTGALRWQRNLPSGLMTHPAYRRLPGRALIAVGDDQGHVAAFEAATGQPVWNRALGGAVGEAIVGVGGVKPGFLVPLLAGTASRGGLVCLDAPTGAIRWRFPSDDRAQSGGMAAPAVEQGRVYWGNDEGAVMCLDAQSGRKIWKTFAAPQKGAKGAPSETLVSLRGAPTVVTDAKIVVLGGNDGYLRAFDLDTGATRWDLKLNGAARFAAQALDFEGQKALLCSGDGPVIFLVAAGDGRVLRRWTTPFSVDFGVVATQGTALALDAEGHLQGALLQ